MTTGSDEQQIECRICHVKEPASMGTYDVRRNWWCCHVCLDTYFGGKKPPWTFEEFQPAILKKPFMGT